MPYASRETDGSEDRAQTANYYATHKAQCRAKDQGWKAKNPKRYAWLGQRHTSKQRGVEFNLTFEEWSAFWGSDFYRRGKRRDTDLQMCRYGDTGAYEIGNIYKATRSENKAGPREKDEGLHEDIPF